MAEEHTSCMIIYLRMSHHSMQITWKKNAKTNLSSKDAMKALSTLLVDLTAINSRKHRNYIMKLKLEKTADENL